MKPVRVEYRQVTTEPDRPPRHRVGEPLSAGFGAVATTVACVLPVFLVGGLAVRVSDASRFSPAGPGLAVSVYVGADALAAVPAGPLTERHGPVPAARAGIALSAAALLARFYAALVLPLAPAATANPLGQLAGNLILARRVPPDRQSLAYGAKQTPIPTCTLLAGGPYRPSRYTSAGGGRSSRRRPWRPRRCRPYPGNREPAVSRPAGR